MKLCLMINTEHQWQESSRHGLLLAHAMTEQGHEVEAVFFYGQAVKVIQDHDLAKEWLKWRHNHPCALLLCRTMLTLRDDKVDTVAGFDVVGMASWVAAMERADRTLEIA